MHESPDPVQFVLDRPMATWPGREWNHNSGTWHLLSAILKRVTGIFPERFAYSELFRPLGIRRYEWRQDRNGLPWGGCGLFLAPRDLAKIGFLYLQNGRWEDKEILHELWVEAATRPHIPVGSGMGYGYGWFVYPDRPSDPPDFYSGLGGTGDNLSVFPQLDLISVLTGDFSVDESMVSFDLLLSHVLDAVKSDDPLPENPDAFARLQAAIDTLAHPPEMDQPPEPASLASLPKTAHEISGKLYRLEANPFLRDFRLSIQDDKAYFIVTLPNGVLVQMPLSFDGVMRYRALTSYFPPMHAGALGNWKGDDVLVIIYAIPEACIRVRLRLEFMGEGVLCTFTSLDVGYTVEVQGQ